ncbi:MAG: oxaloacetate decarboxylase alpha subunit [Armatimonadetes bacterium]|jgi:biotin carboxyl carrier protein|nr:oxaloacetate decarboxylase alpha subunit [Armatimonadota bacterium]
MNVERIEAVLRLLQRQSHVGEVAVEGEGWKLRARRIRGLFPPPPPDAAEADEAVQVSDRQVVRAGMVGIYRAPKKPLRPGDHVAEDAVLGNIDSMRILNPIVAQQTGYVVTALVEDGDAVEFGQELFVLDPNRSPDLDSRSA